MLKIQGDNKVDFYLKWNQTQAGEKTVLEQIETFKNNFMRLDILITELRLCFETKSNS